MVNLRNQFQVGESLNRDGFLQNPKHQIEAHDGTPELTYELVDRIVRYRRLVEEAGLRDDYRGRVPSCQCLVDESRVRCKRLRSILGVTHIGAWVVFEELCVE